MKKYRVVVNGVSYEVELEAMDQASASSAPAAQKAAPAPAPAAAPVTGDGVKAPMPGNIIDVKVSAGQSVKKGQVLFILEAMKMENEILAPADGTVGSVAVTKGQAVETGALLCSFS